MQQSDFNVLSNRCKTLGVHPIDRKRIDTAEYVLFVTKDENALLTDDHKIEIAGFTSDKSTIDMDDVYTNPFDSKTHLKVIDVDYEKERILLAVIDNDS